jgi:hypothetical protein
MLPQMSFGSKADIGTIKRNANHGIGLRVGTGGFSG